MIPEIVNCEQRSPEWFQARLGIPTTSEYKLIVAKGKGKDESKGRRKYMFQLAGEVITGESSDGGFTNRHMERGIEMEAEARDRYQFLHPNHVLTRVGFVRNGSTGGSPDSFVNDDGILEIKTALPHILGELLLEGGFPAEHRAQCQGLLWITGRQWIDIIVYWPKMRSLVKRAHRDEAYIKDLATAVEQFNAELAVLVERLR